MKVSNRIKVNKARAIITGWSLKILPTMILSCMASSAGHTTDLEIYQGATYGNASIMMMLDNSGSMGTGSISSDYSAVSSRDRTSSEKLKQYLYDDKGMITSQFYEYEVEYVSKNGTRYYDRMSRLKMALMPMFANPKSDQAFGKDADLSKYKIGLGSFYREYDNNQRSWQDGGKITNPVVNLTIDNRKKILEAVRSLSASTNTPTANAYAEAGAYMLGASTQKSVYETRYLQVGKSEPKDKNNTNAYKCNENSSQITEYGPYKYYACVDFDRAKNVNKNQNPSVVVGNYDFIFEEKDWYGNVTTYYYKGYIKDWGDSSSSGFSQSSDDTKIKPELSKYDSPIKGEANQCDGYGVYFLTDGEPNTSTSDTIDLMENSLAGSSLSMGSSCDSGLVSTGTTFGTASKWECIGEYSKKLYNKGNPKSTLIATATVGFGSVFKKLTDKGKVTRNITRPSGVVESVEVYQCDADGIDQDAKNLCKLGEKGEGYGNGGFYYTEEPKDIANSVRRFIEDVSTAEIDPISAGTMSVPLDSLGGLESRQFAYLPILEPIPKSPLLWNGNLKKYKVRNSTLLGADDKFVFADSSGLFAKNTHDLWNTIIDTSRLDTVRPDGGAPQIGGAYQQVFESATTGIGNRNLFVDSGNSLVNLKVTANKPVNFNALSAKYSDKQKVTLLNFMGYSEPGEAKIKDNTALTSTQNKALKNIGGVLHSIPQLITKKVAVDATGKFDTSKRKDYIIYGSMDGALHMLDDSTGKETFTFVPKQILDLQPKALTGNGSAEDGSYPYGVDAPWLTHASYTTKSTITGTGDTKTTVNTYEADQSFALGGLRMGGSMYYALDVSDVETPKMIYSVGSNYANKLQDSTLNLSGIKDNVTSITAAEQQAFAKMGQSWGKPALGYVKSGGKRVMVSFLPGGYDTCYENPTFKLNTVYPDDIQCSVKTAAQGNGIYMVQVGEVETKANNEDKVDTSKNNGSLLWWASNSGTSVTAATNATNASLQYSKADDLKHSVVTQVRTLDRNYDGLIDHVYFADLGGQVWRADINNNADTNNFKVDRIVKILDVSDQVGTGDAPPRIYERPLITFYNGKYAYKDAANKSGSANGVQAMVTVGTGDRSNPITATRDVPDALYNIIDKDVARSDLFFYGTGTAPTINLRTPVNKVGITTDANKLQKLTFSAADIGLTGIKQRMQSNAVQGWYMPFNTWLNEATQTTGPYKIKMFNEPDALAGILVSSSYNPDKGQEIKACSAGIKGETQRERTCLPYGTCLDGAGNGVLTNRSTFNAGSGIVDNIVTQFNDTSIFSGLVNRCEGDSCKPKVICPNGDCDPEPPTCTGPTCSPLDGFNTDKRINPLSWIEH
ncbi:hypothetical protein ACQKCF_01760 [Psychrobacter proteolyticus]|uniref:hypothetical protein n=1 Tax=Psychrobacter proteolyticus TaxID=147825 RepID=UPI003D000DB6